MSRVWLLITLSCFASLSGFANNVVIREQHVSCDTNGVRLHGRLDEGTFYGPPGFGETPAKDAQEKQLLLTLEKPIMVVPLRNVDPNKSSCLQTHAHLTKMQLFIYPALKREEARKLTGKMVTVEGTLGEGNAPSDHTEIVVAVSLLRSE